MKSFTEIVEEIKDIVSSEMKGKKVYDKDVANILEITQMNFATLKKRDKIPYDKILDFCAKRSISINWLLYNQAPESLVEPTNRFYMVRYFSEVSASAGGGALNDDEAYEELSIPSTLMTTFAQEHEVKHIEAINVSGDSMEPTLHYGDVVLINRNKKDIARGGVFTINTEHGLFIKRLQKRLDGMVDIISDNKDYPLQVFPLDEVEVIGKVVGRFGGIG